MSMLTRYCCLCVMIFLTTTATSHELPRSPNELTRPQITWIIEDTLQWQDYINKVSKTTSQDTAMIIMQGLEAHGYELNFVKATGARSEKFLRNEDNACISNRLKIPSREKFSLFSLPHDLYLGLQLYRVEQAEPLNEKVLTKDGHIISLTSLFAHYVEDILAVASGASYGVLIDKQIKALEHKNLFVRSGGGRVLSLANMLLKNRIDYIIYYPQDLASINQDRVVLESYTIADSPPYFLGHVACSKTETGKKIIAHVDDILQQAYLSNEFYYAHEKWLITGDLPKLRKYYFEVFNHLPK